MATTKLMIQLYIEQESDPELSDVFDLDDQAFLLLDPTKKTVVREITTQTFGGVIANGIQAMTIGHANTAFASVLLIFSAGEKADYQELYAPSSVASPEFAGAELAMLGVRQSGPTSTQTNLAVRRAIGAHAYIDLVD